MEVIFQAAAAGMGFVVGTVIAVLFITTGILLVRGVIYEWMNK